MPLTVGDVVQLSFSGRVFNQRVLFTHNFRVSETQSSAPSWEILQDIAEFFENDDNPLKSKYLACLPPQYVMNDVRAQVLYPLRLPYESVPTGSPGTQTNATEVSNLAACFTLYSALTGRKQIAVSHVGPISPTYANDGVWNSDVLTPLIDLADECTNTYAITAAQTTLVPVILHKGANQNPRTNDVVGFRIQNTVRTMRRRTVGRGE